METILEEREPVCEEQDSVERDVCQERESNHNRYHFWWLRRQDCQGSDLPFEPWINPYPDGWFFEPAGIWLKWIATIPEFTPCSHAPA